MLLLIKSMKNWLTKSLALTERLSTHYTYLWLTACLRCQCSLVTLMENLLKVLKSTTGSHWLKSSVRMLLHQTRLSWHLTFWPIKLKTRTQALRVYLMILQTWPKISTKHFILLTKSTSTLLLSFVNYKRLNLILWMPKPQVCMTTARSQFKTSNIKLRHLILRNCLDN